jgi:dTDP-3-amino-3,4,6-trideoxy-alpha-D-glucose transaminase
VILMNDFRRRVAALQNELREAIDRVLASGWFILGTEVKAFEQQFAEFLGAKHAIGVGNGMDAISLSLAAAGVGEGDEVITTPNSAFASTLAILQRGALPKFVDIEERGYGLDLAHVANAIGPRTRALLPVHIYGQPTDLTALESLAAAHGLALINDAAQAHGARWRDRDVSSYGVAAAYSFYPTKNLGCFGDGGAVVTNDDAIAAHVRCARDYGQTSRYIHVDPEGLNSRLDELQAAILGVGLRHLTAGNQRRATIARYYTERLRDLPLVLPTVAEGATSVHHLFVVRTPRRDALMRFLHDLEIVSLVHYPTIIPLQPAMSRFGYRRGQFPVAERCADEILSLPIHPELTDNEVEAVVAAVRGFFATGPAAAKT